MYSPRSCAKYSCRRMRHRHAHPLFAPQATLALLLPGRARAEGPNTAAKNTDTFQLSAHNVTYAELFRRALLPGQNGTLVRTSTAAPVYDYASLQAANVDTPWRKDSLDMELAVWGRGWLGSRQGEQPLDGDVQVANVGYRQGALGLRLGRQQVVGGAARFARFDGLKLDADLGAGLDVDGYGGWTVLPRWDQRPRYEHLGAAADSLLIDPAQLEAVPRRRYWLGGGRLGWASGNHRAGISFHEQRDAGRLARRSAGLDARTDLGELATLGTSAVLDLDRGRFADARLWLDTRPMKSADLSFEYLHTEPALFLSSQSVLSVFGSAAYDEAGSYGSWRVGRSLTVDGSGFVEVYDGERPGARGELGTRWFADAAHRLFLRLTCVRLLAPDNGYDSVRAALSQKITQRLRATLESYFYFYDKAIQGYRASSVYASTLSFDPSEQWRVLWGASLAHSPYANVDAQTELRVAYSFDVNGGGR